MKKIKILIVCAWPLGGIRTFLKYNYHYFTNEEFEVTLLANNSIEKNAVEYDMNEENINVIWAKTFFKRNILFFDVACLLLTNKFDIIHSQGWISSFNVSLSNFFFRIPHVMTIHGILEKKYLKGIFANLKKRIMKLFLSNVDVFHGVSYDILNHVKESFPTLQTKKFSWVVINNGIRSNIFLNKDLNASENLHKKLSVSKDVIIFGFFGRFMPQKGFNYIIKAVNLIEQKNIKINYMILAVGSGDYENEYKRDIKNMNLSNKFIFLPFENDISQLIKGCHAVLMPSLWEAWGLLASESLCAGVPLIASDCIGLREATRETPTIVISQQNTFELSEAMINVIYNKEDIKEKFIGFMNEAGSRFDVKYSARKLISLFKSL